MYRGDERYLIEALVDPDHRSLAARYLGELEAESATKPLLRLLDASDPHARAAAAGALGRIGARDALPQLREIAVHDDEPWVRAWATET